MMTCAPPPATPLALVLSFGKASVSMPCANSASPPVPGIEDDVRARGHVVEDLGDGATFVRAIAAIAQFLQDPVRPLPGSSPRATSSSIVSWRPFCAT